VQELPAFQEVYESHAGRFDLLAIAVTDQYDPEGFVKDKPFTFPFAYSPEAVQAYRVGPIPRTLFIDSQGNLSHSQLGAMSASQFAAEVAKIL